MAPYALRCIATVLAAALALPAAAATPDRAIKRQLEQRKLEYGVDEAGDFKLTFDLGGGRSQLAFVRSSTVAFGELEVREILSIGYRGDPAGLPPAVANRLLEHGNGAKIGGWVKQGALAIFVARIPADADADELVAALEATVRLADEIERELTPDKDEF